MTKTALSLSILAFFVSCLFIQSTLAQKPENKQRVRTMTVPISIFTKQELKEKQLEEYVQAERLTVREDNEEQQILSIRSVGDSTLSIEVLIQEDLASSFNLKLKD